MKHLLSVFLALILSGCSLFDEKKEEDKLAPLPAIDNQSVNIKKIWSRSIGDLGIDDLGLRLNAHIDSDRIYAASMSGQVFAINRFSGDLIWKSDIDKNISGPVSSYGDLVFVSDDGGKVHALAASNGDEVWSAQASSEILSKVAADNYFVVVQSADSKVQAFDVSNGERKWIYSASQSVLSLRGNAAPLLYGGVVFSAFDNGKVVALDARTGIPLWEQRFIIPDGRSELERVIDVQSTPLFSKEHVFVGAYQGAIVSLEAASGRPVWEQKASVSKNMAEDESVLFVVDGRDVLRAFSTDSGSEFWKTNKFEGRFLSSLAVVSGKVVFGDREGYIHVVDRDSGEYLGRYSLGGGGVTLDVLASGKIFYTLSNSGTLYAFEVTP